MTEGAVLGIDTSNYTTSAAVLRDGQIVNRKRPLEVASGERGVRQNEAVFRHVKQLDEVLEPFLTAGGISLVGVSDRPRGCEDSYMPCFLVGLQAAKLISSALSVPVESFSHQQGHIAAALFSEGRLDLMSESFIAFHVSGGTTEALFVNPDKDEVLKTEIAAASLDLKAGQAIDRVGVLLGLDFPCGPQLERLALACDDKLTIKPSMKGADCSLSGVENICARLVESGAEKSYTARFCIEAVLAALDGMCAALLKGRRLPVVFSGGVSSNSIIRDRLSAKYGALFATPEFSADNAAGPALLAAMRRRML